MKDQIEVDDVRSFAVRFSAEPKNRLALNAVVKNGVASVALNQHAVSNLSHTYSHLIETPEATNQNSSGRCWLFAGLNTLRLLAMKSLNLEQFELSQTYLMFWDKLEKANYFLEGIISTINEPLDGRLVMWLLADPISDAGQWDMFVNLVEKYGVVPKSVMPETASSGRTRDMNEVLAAKLREWAWVLREQAASGARVDDMRSAKDDMLAEFYRMLAIHLGQPPVSFLWEWRDKDKAFHRYGRITPLHFFREYIAATLDDMVCLINAPTGNKEYNRLYTVQHLGNVVGGRGVRYLNVDIEVMKQAAVQMIVDGTPVWFGCDVGKWLEHDLGVMDLDVYDYELVYGTNLGLDKARRLDYGHSRMTHAMVLTGVDLDDGGRPMKWRVENSWGTDLGDKGYMIMTDRWFSEYLYELTVSRRYLSPELLEVLETDPVALPPWDPMGSLARGDALL
ncbi:MAG: C1 family peptidase [Chloroflexi bacterium]|nr:C1 family peptidase [Chloroflexota bacterium]